MILSADEPTLPFSLHDVSLLQQGAETREQGRWKRAGKYDSDQEVWFGPSGLPYLPRSAFSYLAKLSHGIDHASKGRMTDIVNTLWTVPGFSVYAENFCKKCVVCARHNVGRAITVPLLAHPTPSGPFKHLMIDFIELTPCEGYKYCLVMVDMFSRWVEVVPCRKATALAVARALLKDVIPQWGLPSRISSDNGSHFVNEVGASLGKTLQIDIDKENEKLYWPFLL